jgi:hypothetical protein
LRRTFVSTSSRWRSVTLLWNVERVQSCARVTASAGRICSHVLAPAFHFTDVHPLASLPVFSSPSQQTNFLQPLSYFSPRPTNNQTSPPRPYANMSQSHIAIAVNRATYQHVASNPDTGIASVQFTDSPGTSKAACYLQLGESELLDLQSLIR